MIALALAASLVAAPTASTDPADQLPAEWIMGDYGTPFTWQGHRLHVYADPATEHGLARSIVTVDGEAIVHPLSAPDDRFYWLTDGVELPDGRLLVAALEVENTDGPNDGWAFAVVDTDLFVVNDPTSPQSWAIASLVGKLESGWWDGHWVEFSDQWDGLAFADSAAYTYSPDIVTAERVATLPESHGVFAPVQTDTGWTGIAWDYWANTATYWTADTLGSAWTEGETTTYDADGQTHAHGLNIIDGEIVHRWSTLRQRPTYEPLEAP